MSPTDQLFLDESQKRSPSPQGRAGRAVYLLMTEGPKSSSELTNELGYRTRFTVYDLMDNLSRSVPVYYDETRGVFGILE